jgi:hypothetical protein
MKRLHRLPLVFLLLFVPISGWTEEVTIYRVKKFFGSALKPSIYVDGRQVARIQNGRYFTLDLPPAHHHVFSSTAKGADLELDIKPGEKHYIEMVILPGTWRGGGRLVPVSESDGKAAIQKLKPLDHQFIFTQEPSQPPPAPR